MSWKLSEPAISALVARLAADLPAAIATINANINDTYTLTVPPAARILDHVPSIHLLRDWPTLGIQELPLRISDDIGTSARATLELVVLAFENDPSLEALARRLRRWGQAIAMVLDDNRSLGVAGADAYLVQMISTEPGPTLGDHEDPTLVKTYSSWRGVLVRLDREEE